MICLGKTLTVDFDLKNYLTSEKKFPIKTYFIDCGEISNILMNKFEKATEICPNLIYLGRSGIIEIEKNIKLGFLNGVECKKYTELYSSLESTNHEITFSQNYFTPSDINIL